MSSTNARRRRAEATPSGSRGSRPACSRTVRPFPSSRAIAKRLPADWTRSRSAPSPSAADTCKELDARRETILRSIDEQGKLTDELRRRLGACGTKAELEDLYLPYKPRRRTKASVARERGLGPLAERILAQPDHGRPEDDAARFVDPSKGVPGVAEALSGAHDILVEVVAENARARAFLAGGPGAARDPQEQSRRVQDLRAHQVRGLL